MYATNYLEVAVLNLFRGQSMSAPATVYLALFLNNPSETGQAGTEVSYQGYSRQVATFSAAAELNGGIGIQTSGDITFPRAPVAIGTVTHIGVMDSITGGNMLLYAELTESMIVDADEAPVIVSTEAQWWLTADLSISMKTKIFNFIRGTNIDGFVPYLSLWNGNPDSGGAELSGAGYARVELTFGAPEEQSSGQSKISNSIRATTNRSLAPWGTWTNIVIMDTAANGSPAYYVTRAAKDIRKGMLVVVEVGSLNLLLN